MIPGRVINTLHHGLWRSVCFLRQSSSKSPFSDTVLLPKTAFPGKITANVAEHEKAIQEAAGFNSLYEWQRKHNEANPTFILHDGPPYANGDVHVGHALNKILKDITNRYKLLRGYQVHYVPGWDCHGLPIEIKAIKSKDFHKLTPSEVRATARKYARKTIEKQKQAFKRWGVMANWHDVGCYFTYSKDFEAKELQAFYAIFKKGYIYRDLKPVYWSPSSGTALAEAELEYNISHKSRSTYIAFPLKTIPDLLRPYVPPDSDNDLSIMVWTTQPWTLPANQAVCFSPSDRYCLVRRKGNNESGKTFFILAEEQVENVEQILDSKLEVILSFDGTILQGCHCLHPMDRNHSTPLLPSSHVTMEKGTGFVHIAPAHGAEDFELAIKHGLNSKSNVDDHGNFTVEAGYGLEGKFIFTEGNESVLQILQGNNTLVHEHDYEHSYPYDWRTKKPIFIKTSRQWFVDTNALQDVARGLLNGVEITPSSGKTSMLSHLKGRTFWCISRQRSWGVPIPVFYNRNDGKMLLTDSSIQHIISLMRKHGSDVWWNLPISDLLPQSVIDESEFKNCSPNDFEPGRDILDIWFDSGLTWAGVLGGENGLDFSCAPIADLYLEGKDQYGGWFQSSLLTSAAIRATAPYKNLLVHGFVMSESGQKMSKSLGNVVDPMVVTDGGKNKSKDPPYGADVLRWWVAESNVHQEVIIGKKVLDAARDSLNKTRLCFRFLLGNLADFSPEKHLVCHHNMQSVDRYILHLLYEYSAGVSLAYDNFEYGKVTRLLLSFITKLSSFYFTIVKDRLYCEEQHGQLRTSCQSVLYYTLNVLAKSVAPILPHTMEEVVKHHPYPGSISIFKSGWCDADIVEDWRDENLKSEFEALLTIRESFLANLEGKQPVLYDIHIKAQGNLLDTLKDLNKSESQPFSELRELFGCSSCTVTEKDLPPDSNIVESNVGSCTVAIMESKSKKCRRCRCLTSEKASEPCVRCTHVIAGPWAA